MQYKKRDGNFVLFDDRGHLLSSSPEIAVVFDGHVLLKHGPEKAVRKWQREARDRYQGAGYGQLLSDWVLISSREWDVEELNKIINITGYVPKELRDNGRYQDQESV